MYKNRSDAGQKLAKKLSYLSKKNLIVIAIPRGGVVLGYELAKSLHVQLEIVVARKIGSPYNKELGIGAIAEENISILDTNIIKQIGIPKGKLNKLIEEEKVELNRRVRLFRKSKKFPSLLDKIVIIVDDGLATGVTAIATIMLIKKHNPKEIIYTAPVCAFEAIQKINSLVDKIVCPLVPSNLQSIGMCYKNFDQVTDEEVLKLLSKAEVECA